MQKVKRKNHNVIIKVLSHFKFSIGKKYLLFGAERPVIIIIGL